MKIKRLAMAVALAATPLLANAADNDIAGGLMKASNASIVETSKVVNEAKYFEAKVALKEQELALKELEIKLQEAIDKANEEGIRKEIRKELEEKYAAENSDLLNQVESMSKQIEKMKDENRKRKNSFNSESPVVDKENLMREDMFAVSKIFGFKGKLKATVHFEGKKVTVKEKQSFAPDTFIDNITKDSVVVVTGGQKFTLYPIPESAAVEQTTSDEDFDATNTYDPTMPTYGQMPMQPMVQLPGGKAVTMGLPSDGIVSDTPFSNPVNY